MKKARVSRFAWTCLVAGPLLTLVACDSSSSGVATTATVSAVASFPPEPAPSASSNETPAASLPEATRAAACIYASADRGMSWARSDAGIPTTSTIVDFAVAQETVFAAAGPEGVFASRDRGRSWRATRSLGANVAATALASTAATLFVGTRSDGVFASRDAGKTWVEANLGLENLDVRRMHTVGPRVFAATDGGLFASDDQGATWKHLTGSGQTNAIVAAHGDLFLADVQGILRSADQGVTWERVYDKSTPHNLSADGDTVFAMLYGAGVVRSGDAGHTWQSAQLGLPTDLTQYTFQILPIGGVRLAGQWHGIYVSNPADAPWRPSSPGIPSTQAVTDIIRVQDTFLAAAVPSLPKPQTR